MGIPSNPAPVPASPMFPHVQPPANPANPSTPAVSAAPIVTEPPIPAGFALGRFGQLCAQNPNAVCQATTDVATTAATPGFVKCEGGYDCCLCAAVDCVDCIALTAGDSALFGVKNVNVYGATRGGASLVCQGVESCAPPQQTDDSEDEEDESEEEESDDDEEDDEEEEAVAVETDWKELIQPLLLFVRFPIMAGEYFAAQVVELQLISADDCTFIMQYLLTSKESKALKYSTKRRAIPKKN